MGAKLLICSLLFASTANAQPGSLDITFNPGTGASQGISSIAIQTNGQILIGGNFTTVNGITNENVARLNSDGSVDTSFNTGRGTLGINCIASQSDGKVLIGGSFNSQNGNPSSGVERLRTDGSIDISFQPATGSGTIAINALSIQNDGKILVAGYVSLSSGTNVAVARFNSDGSLDSSFNGGASPPVSQVTGMVLQPNGQILVAAAVISATGINRTNVARLNSDGTIDTTFMADPIAGSPGQISCLLGLTNGQVVIGGYFATINGYTRQGIARLNIDGTLDTQFGRPYSPSNPSISAMALQSNGDVLIVGASGVNPIRLTTNGLNDASFSPGAGANEQILAMAVQPDGKTLIGGSFFSYNGTNISRIARLNGDNPASTNLQFLAPNLYFGMYLQGTVSNTYRVEWTSKLSTPSLWTPLTNVILKTNPQFILDTNPAGGGGQRFYRSVALP